MVGTAVAEPARPPKELGTSGREMWRAVQEPLNLDRHEQASLARSLPCCGSARRAG